VNKAIEI
jgi:hypothetical protein